MALQSSKYRPNATERSGAGQCHAAHGCAVAVAWHLWLQTAADAGDASADVLWTRIAVVHAARCSAVCNLQSSLCAPQFCAAMAASSSFRTLSEVELRDKLSVIILSPPPLHHNRLDPCPIRLGVELGAGADLSESSTRCFQGVRAGVKAWRGFQYYVVWHVGADSDGGHCSLVLLGLPLPWSRHEILPFTYWHCATPVVTQWISLHTHALQTNILCLIRPFAGIERNHFPPFLWIYFWPDTIARLSVSASPAKGMCMFVSHILCRATE